MVIVNLFRDPADWFVLRAKLVTLIIESISIYFLIGRVIIQRYTC